MQSDGQVVKKATKSQHIICLTSVNKRWYKDTNVPVIGTLGTIYKYLEKETSNGAEQHNCCQILGTKKCFQTNLSRNNKNNC